MYLDLQSKISPKRFRHILGVVEAAEALAIRYGENPTKARIAALLHDCAKEIPIAKMQKIVNQSGVRIDSELYHNPVLLHGPVGAMLASSYYDIDDTDILESIRVHTTGKVGMNKLDKIIFLADYIEKNRDFPGVEQLRELAFFNLNEAVLAGFDSTIRFLLQSNTPIYIKTILGRNDIIFQIHKKGLAD